MDFSPFVSTMDMEGFEPFSTFEMMEDAHLSSSPATFPPTFDPCSFDRSSPSCGRRCSNWGGSESCFEWGFIGGERPLVSGPQRSYLQQHLLH